MIAAFVRRHGVRSVLFVGCGEGAYSPNAQFVEREISKMVEASIGVDIHRKARGPWTYVCGDALRLPFADASFDLVLSNAVVEHVGGESQQHRFVAEHARVGREWIVTTPNRWFPIESHTRKALVHWSPAWRAKQQVFTRLLSRREFRSLAATGGATCADTC